MKRMATTEPERVKAYSQGWLACLEGMPIEMCPYGQSVVNLTLMEFWQLGWRHWYTIKKLSNETRNQDDPPINPDLYNEFLGI